ncbi:MAG: hypothetical protein LBQ59_00805 [Candidatus Peribacteria bacterium]|nr:hypothetical protein [Candidatus Peribacteria bacterium]
MFHHKSSFGVCTQSRLPFINRPPLLNGLVAVVGLIVVVGIVQVAGNPSFLHH